MRKVNKSQIADLSCDEQAEWPLSSEKVNSQLDALRQKMANGGTISSEDITGLYGDTRVRELLRRDFSNRCAYCESHLDFATSYPPVEHYRPKAGYKDGNSSTLKRPGYWWLAYEWDNLLLSCQVCNSQKGNHFPLADESKRNIRGQDITQEDPLILNPIVDDPKEHIGFKCEYAVPKSDSIKGETTIKLCDLNRDELVNNRRDAWIEFNDYDLKLSQLYKVLESMPDDSNILKDVVNLLEKRRQMLVELAFTSMFDNQVE